MRLLADILFDVYHPNSKMEDFLMTTTSTTDSSKQHLPERSYACRDCDWTFDTAAEFSEHFERAGDSIFIIGCKPAEPLLFPRTAQREATT